MRSAEHCVETAVGIDHENSGRMIHGVVVAIGRLLLEKNTEAGCEPGDFFQGARDAQVAVTKIVDVLAEEFRRVTFRIDADENNPWKRGLTLCGERRFGRGQNLESRRANVRTVREAKKDQVPLSPEDGAINGSTLLVDE